MSEALAKQFARRWALYQRGGVAARLNRWRVWHLLAIQKLGIRRWARVPVFFGEKIWILTGERLSAGLLAFGCEEAALTALMIATLRPGMRIVDAGTHLGYEAMLASVLVGPRGRVAAFEPQPEIAAMAERSLRPFPQARLVASAVGDREGMIELLEFDLVRSAFNGVAPSLQGGRLMPRPLTTLDHALSAEERPVDFLKCDVEGAELSVLRGAAGLIAADRPLIVLEAGMPDDPLSRRRVQEFTDFLAPLGYGSFAFEYDGKLKTGAYGRLPVGHANVAFAPRSRSEFAALLDN